MVRLFVVNRQHSTIRLSIQHCYHGTKMMLSTTTRRKKLPRSKEKDLPSYMMGDLIDPSVHMGYLGALCPVEEKVYTRADSHHGFSPFLYGFAGPIERQDPQPYVLNNIE